MAEFSAARPVLNALARFPSHLLQLFQKPLRLHFSPCQPALTERPPAGPSWLHEIKFDGYRVIARKDGAQVRMWARTTSDYSKKAFTRIPGRRRGAAGRERSADIVFLGGLTSSTQLGRRSSHL